MVGVGRGCRTGSSQCTCSVGCTDRRWICSQAVIYKMHEGREVDHMMIARPKLRSLRKRARVHVRRCRGWWEMSVPLCLLQSPHNQPFQTHCWRALKYRLIFTFPFTVSYFKYNSGRWVIKTRLSLQFFFSTSTYLSLLYVSREAITEHCWIIYLCFTDLWKIVAKNRCRKWWHHAFNKPVAIGLAYMWFKRSAHAHSSFIREQTVRPMNQPHSCAE